MKRILVLFLLLMVLAAIFAGCGGNGDAVDSSNDSGSGTSDGGPVGQAESAACAANRATISSAARQYQAMEGAYASSLQQLVPGYLQSVPVCPSGGTYTLQGSTVTCSVHGQ